MSSGDVELGHDDILGMYSGVQIPFFFFKPSVCKIHMGSNAKKIANRLEKQAQYTSSPLVFKNFENVNCP